jgi:hypothetical protein
MWDLAKFEERKPLIRKLLESGERIIPVMPAPEVAFASNESVLASFVELINSSDDFAAVYIIKAVGSDLNDAQIIQDQLAELATSLTNSQIVSENNVVLKHVMQELQAAVAQETFAGQRIRQFLESVNLLQEA